MSYINLARKYRPQTFETVASQKFPVQALKNSIQKDTISPAYLFSGPRGTGKTSLARIFAKALNCEDLQDGNPCCVCTNCVEIADDTSVDVVEIDGASNRGINEIRILKENVKYLPVKSRYKIYIIDEVHMLTTEAFNAILKTLEEPPSYVVFIFATTDVHKLPVTILSRCLRFNLSKIPFEAMVDRMGESLDTEGVSYEMDALKLIARNADGGMRDAYSLLDQVIAYSDGKVDLQLVKSIFSLDDQEIANKLFYSVLTEDHQTSSELLLELESLGVSYRLTLELFARHLRNLLFIQGGVLDSLNLSEEDKDFYASMSSDVSHGKLFMLFQIFQKAESDLPLFTSEQYIFEFAVYKALHHRSLLPTIGFSGSNDSQKIGSQPDRAIGNDSRVGPVDIKKKILNSSENEQDESIAETVNHYSSASNYIDNSNPNNAKVNIRHDQKVSIDNSRSKTDIINKGSAVQTKELAEPRTDSRTDSNNQSSYSGSTTSNIDSNIDTSSNTDSKEYTTKSAKRSKVSLHQSEAMEDENVRFMMDELGAKLIDVKKL